MTKDNHIQPPSSEMDELERQILAELRRRGVLSSVAAALDRPPDENAEVRKGWHYQIIFHDKDPGGPWIGLHEVYRTRDRITGWTEGAVEFVAHPEEGAGGVIGSLEMALRDARRWPVLVESELEALHKTIDQQ